MAKGDIKTTEFSKPIIIYAKLKAAETPVAGDPVVLDLNGEIVKATAANARTDGPVMYLTAYKHPADTLYLGVLKKGRITTTAGAAIKPRQYVSVDASSKIIALVKTVTTTYVEAEMEILHLARAGFYISHENENDLSVTDAALNDLIVVEVDA